MAASDKRRQNRHPQQSRIKLHWNLPDGCTVYVTGECRDISKTGMRVKVERRVEPGQMVRVESAQFHLAGVSYVRHCRPEGLKFVLGIEFSGGLTWNQPQSP